jgi:hypothetical protein
MDRIHFIEHAVERLDDEAFAAFLTWFDHYADTRWAGRHRDSGVAAMGYAVADSVTNSVAMSPAMICEPQLAAWSAHAALEE